MKRIPILSFIAAGVFFIVLSFDFLAYCVDHFSEVRKQQKFLNQYNFVTPSQNFKYNFKLKDFDKDFYLNVSDNSQYRLPVNTASPLSPVFLFGCSFAYGAYLDLNDTFGAKIAEATNRPVYNFAAPGRGIQHMLFLLENYNFSNLKAPEYVVFVYYDDQIRRMNAKWFLATDNNANLVYKKMGDKLVPYNPFSCFFIYRKISAILNSYKSSSPYFKTDYFNRFVEYISVINHIIKKKWPNSKFIILKYQTDARMSFDWSAVEKIGIPVYDVNDYINLSEDKYSLPDKHPSALAWKEITPNFVKNTGM